MILPKIYNTAILSWPAFNISKDSKPKAEKVVNEPNTPIIKKYLTNIKDVPWFSKLLAKIPIKKHPIKFTKSVPIGKLGK